MAEAAVGTHISQNGDGKDKEELPVLPDNRQEQQQLLQQSCRTALEAAWQKLLQILRDEDAVGAAMHLHNVTIGLWCCKHMGEKSLDFIQVDVCLDYFRVFARLALAELVMICTLLHVVTNIPTKHCCLK